MRSHFLRMAGFSRFVRLRQLALYGSVSHVFPLCCGRALVCPTKPERTLILVSHAMKSDSSIQPPPVHTSIPEIRSKREQFTRSRGSQRAAVGATSLSSAETQRCDGWCQEILVVETTQHGVRAHGKTLAQAMSGSETGDAMRCRGGIRDTGTQGHMWTRVIVMGNPRFESRP